MRSRKIINVNHSHSLVGRSIHHDSRYWRKFQKQNEKKASDRVQQECWNFIRVQMMLHREEPHNTEQFSITQSFSLTQRCQSRTSDSPLESFCNAFSSNERVNYDCPKPRHNRNPLSERQEWEKYTLSLWEGIALLMSHLNWNCPSN